MQMFRARLFFYSPFSNIFEQCDNIGFINIVFIQIGRWKRGLMHTHSSNQPSTAINGLLV